MESSAAIKKGFSAPGSQKVDAKNVVPRPFLKWAGGKGQLIAQLLDHAPITFQAYHEPFVGGGALFFALCRRGLLRDKPVHLSDVNAELIDSYRAIQRQVEKVLHQLSEPRFTHSRKNFMEIRALDPKDLSIAERAARMIFLNRTGFNGLYRVNSRGQFNVPFGRHQNPTIRDPRNLLAVSGVLKKVNLHHEPFENVLDRAKRGDFVYFDPPYVPLSRTANFVSYASDGFSLKEQGRLARVFKALHKKGAFAMLSNSNTGWVRDLYKDFRRIPIQAKRTINSRSDRRGPVDELLVVSFDPGGGN